MSNPSIDPGNSKKRKPSELHDPIASNRLLAGYLAHEFLTNGTLFGQIWDSKSRCESGKNPDSSGLTPPTLIKPKKTYCDVAFILKIDGAHIPGVVNPTQLAQWLQR